MTRVQRLLCNCMPHSKVAQRYLQDLSLGRVRQKEPAGDPSGLDRWEQATAEDGQFVMLSGRGGYRGYRQVAHHRDDLPVDCGRASSSHLLPVLAATRQLATIPGYRPARPRGRYRAI